MQNGNDTVVRKNLCGQCSTGKHKCFVCKEHTEEVRKCSEKKCGYFYHLKCLQEQNYPHQVLKQGQFKCPMHTCLTCYHEHLEDYVIRTVKKKLKTCIKCPIAYHSLDSCVAAGATAVGSDHVLCPEHVDYDYKGNKLKKKSKPCNVNWCFSCNFGGELFCCERCPAAICLECVKKEEGQVPGDEGYICSDCRARKQFHYNDIVWVKHGSFRWWPAQIKLPQNVPDNVLNLNHLDADFPVYFFGSKDYYWVNKSRAFLYMEGDDQKKIHTSGSLGKVFKQAMIEVADAFKKWQENKNNILQSKTVNPAPYFHLKVNKPFGKCQQSFVDMDKSNKQVCECNESDPCSSDVDCLNRLLMYECDGAICKNQDKCKNQRFKKREYAKTEKFRTQAGWGLRSLEEIKKGQFVIEYVGELIDEEECNRRLKLMAERSDRNFYFLTIDKDCIIDAGPKGNLARFMNHSCDPNCETQKWVVNNQVRVGLFAKRDLPAGSELTFNYNLECRGDEKTKCLCNSKNCSGFIGVRPNKIVEEKQTKEARKRKNKPAFASIHEDECFRCGEVGKLIMCDKRDCPKSYHLACLNLDKIPHGKWNCPVHHCDECGKKAIVFCHHCPTSYCDDHKKDNEMKMLANGELICNDHSQAYLNKVRRIALKEGTTPKSTNNNSLLARASSSSTPHNRSRVSSSTIDLNTGNSIKKPRRSNVHAKEEVDELRKKDEERKRKLIESRNDRMKKRSSLQRAGKQQTVEHRNQEINDNNLNESKTTEMEVDYDIDFNSNSSLSTTNLNQASIGQRNGDINGFIETAKDKIVQEEEDKLNNNSSSNNNQSSSSTPVKNKSISQKENLGSLEMEPGPKLDRIFSDEVLFNDDSNESYLSQAQLNGTPQKIKLDNQTNGTSQQPQMNGNSNNENKNHNLMLSTSSALNNELNEPVVTN